MASRELLSQFVYDALMAGKSPAEIRAALVEAGWPPAEARTALAAYAETDFLPPVPRPRPRLSAREVFLYGLLFTALAFVASHVIALAHGIIDLGVSDPASDGYRRGMAHGRIRWSIAVLVVATPLYLWLSVVTNRSAETETETGPPARLSLARIVLTYLTLYLTAFIFLGDAVYVVYRLLDGELGLRVLLKALVVAGVTAGVFLFYLRDVRQGQGDA